MVRMNVVKVLNLSFPRIKVSSLTSPFDISVKYRKTHSQINRKFQNYYYYYNNITVQTHERNTLIYRLHTVNINHTERGRWRVKLTTHLHVVPRLRMMELYLHSPTRLHDVKLNELSTGITLPLPHVSM
jgi:hypothetical protein